MGTPVEHGQGSSSSGTVCTVCSEHGLSDPRAPKSVTEGFGALLTTGMVELSLG